MNIQVTNVQVQPTEVNRGRHERGCIYLHMSDESLVENLVNRRARPYEEYKKHLGTIIDMAKKEDITPKDITPEDFRWSQQAGCKCGCSPGFVLKKGTLPVNIFADIKIS